MVSSAQVYTNRTTCAVGVVDAELAGGGAGIALACVGVEIEAVGAGGHACIAGEQCFGGD